MVDIMDVKVAVKSGRLKTDITNGEIILRDMQTEEAVKIGVISSAKNKTADEMFRYLGYIKTKQKDGDYIVYENKSEFLRIEVDLKYNVVAKYDNWVKDNFDFAEIRAICKLLDELGGVNG